MKSLILLYSYHHGNTEKIAQVFSKILDAPIMRTRDLVPSDVYDFDLVCFGSGIYGDQHHPSMLEFVDRLTPEEGKKAFIFSTAAISTKAKIATDHSHVRDKLESKGYTVVGEYQCVGFNTNSFLKYIGGMNKGRPNAKDLMKAEEIATKIKES